MRHNRIGVFDSGIGGLTVLRELKRLMPHTDMVYLGDSARLPYGTKSSKTIIRYSLQCARFLVSMDIDLCVVACNTASAHSIPSLRNALGIPVVGVIDAGARAAVSTHAEKIGVIGTNATIHSRVYEETIHALDPMVQIHVAACPLFVSLVEEGWCEDDITALVARRYLGGIKEKGIETLVLGCTHYPLLKRVIADVMGRDIEIVDSALSTAKQVKQILREDPACTASGNVVYYLTDISPHFIELGEMFLHEKMTDIHEIDLNGGSE